MKRARVSEEQIIGLLKAGEAAGNIRGVCREHSITEQTFYRWRRVIAIIATSGTVACAQPQVEPQHAAVSAHEAEQIPWSQVPQAQQAAIQRATNWLKDKELNQISPTWQYRLGNTSACSPYLTSLEDSAQTRGEGEREISESGRHEGWWLLTDLETTRFWLLVTMEFFGPLHYFGPAKLTPQGQLEPLPASEVDHTCLRWRRLPPNKQP